MVCIYCHSGTRVVNSRLQKRSNNIWRRRVCSVCAATFTTKEIPELTTSFMVKNDSSQLEPFLREKLFLSIYASCRHRPTPLSDAIGLSQTVTDGLTFPTGEPISSTDIARVTHEVLKRFDKVAATFYQAYHLKNASTS